MRSEERELICRMVEVFGFDWSEEAVSTEFAVKANRLIKDARKHLERPDRNAIVVHFKMEGAEEFEKQYESIKEKLSELLAMEAKVRIINQSDRVEVQERDAEKFYTEMSKIINP
jgi:intracellular sulfur oxidation DsrE/DsrF family protein